MSYGAPPPPPAYGGGGYGGQPAAEHPQGTTILVLGILSLVCCSPLGIAAVVMGRKAQREIDSSGYQYSNAGLVKAGFICGIIGCVLLALSLLYVVFVLVLAVGASSS